MPPWRHRERWGQPLRPRTRAAAACDQDEYRDNGRRSRAFGRQEERLEGRGKTPPAVNNEAVSRGPQQFEGGEWVSGEKRSEWRRYGRHLWVSGPSLAGRPNS